MKQNRYKENIIGVRSPLVSIEEYNKTFDCKNMKYEDMLNIFNNNAKIRESILFASPNLYFAIKDEKGNKEKLLNSFIKYYIRMSTRPTPFGLFSGISFNERFIKHEINCRQKICTVDFEWLIKLISRIELNIDILYDLKIISNKNILKEKTIITNPYVSVNYQQDNPELNHKTIVTIKNNNVVEYVLERCNKYICFYDVFNELRQILGNKIPPYKIVNLMIKLIKDEFLYTELRPKLPKDDNLENTIQILSKIDAAEIYTRKILRIKKLIDKYNQSSYETGENILINLLEIMEKLQKSDKYLQVISGYESFDESVYRNYVPNTNNFFKTLNLIKENIPVTEKTIMNNYKNKFIEKYGFERQVPFLEMIDSQIGIGFPDYFLDAPQNMDVTKKKFMAFINNKIIDSINNSTHSINIKYEDLIDFGFELKDNNETKSASNESFDLVFLNSKNPMLSPLVGISGAGRIVDRFLPLVNINDEYIDFIKTVRLIDNVLNPCELSVLPLDMRCVNITSKSVVDTKNIVLGTDGKNSINLNDIYVTIIKNHLTLLYNNKALNLYVTNMMNPEKCPNIYRVLQDMSETDSIIEAIIYIHNSIQKYNYIPKVCIEGIMLFPETWIINMSLLEMNESSSFELFNKNINIYMTKNFIPRYFYLKHFDNILLLDAHNLSHLKLLYVEVKKKVNDFIQLTYGGEVLEDIPTKEIVVSYQSDQNNQPNNISMINHYVSRKDYLSPLTSDWIYIKVYAKKYTLKRIIQKEIRAFSNSLLNNKDIDKYFFINFADDKDHLRLRFHNSNQFTLTFNKILTYISYLYDKYDIYNISIDTYDREIERYGGLEMIDITESLFYKNSEITIDLLNYKHKNFSKDELAILEVLYFLKGLNYNIGQIDSLFSHIDNKYQLKNFKSNKDKYIELYQYVFEDNIFDTKLKTILESQNAILDEFVYKIKSSNLTNSETNILLSHIHMFCNRYFGIDRQSENRICAIIKHMVHFLKGYKKYHG